jgi:hypothetical protein
MKYKARISARREGAIGAHGTVQRDYEIEASRQDVVRLAIDAAYEEGGVEHVKVLWVRPVNEGGVT